MRRALALALLLSTSVLLGGCEWHWPWALTGRADSPGGSTASLVDAPGGSVGPPLGGVPGGLRIEGEPNMANPLEGQPQALAGGRRLFLGMNCASCHGYDATGGMGPNLTDKQWRYAGTPAAVFNSIAQGRPQGMPSWGRTLPEEQIWSIVSYLESLGGTYQAGQYNASLEGDTDKTQMAPGYATVERVTASLAPQQTQPPAQAANPAPGLKQ
jgi:cytochrome c oxidase cbb3-type subunit 3